MCVRPGNRLRRTESRRERMVAEMKNRDQDPTPEESAADSGDPKSAPLLELESQLKANRRGNRKPASGN